MFECDSHRGGWGILRWGNDKRLQKSQNEQIEGGPYARRSLHGVAM